MGVMRFLVHPAGRVTDEIAQRVYFTGLDRVPWRSSTRRTNEGFVVERAVSDSGNLHVPWMVPGHGEVTLSTASLVERDRPYHLHVELARGKVSQVRTQLWEWQAVGLDAPPELLERLHEAIELFAYAATSQHDVALAAENAEKAIAVAVRASNLLGSAVAEQSIAARLRHSPKLLTHLGVNLGEWRVDDANAKLLRAAFNSAIVPIGWQEVESSQGSEDWSVADAQVAWCASQGMFVYGGPIVRLDSVGLPDWLYLWEGDFENIVMLLTEFVTKAITRYRGKVQCWLCASRVNVGNVLSLSEIDKQRLAVKVIEITRRLDPHTPVLLCFDQPWGEYLNSQEVEPPLYFADLLARAGIGLAGICLEMNVGYYPGGTYSRDMLDISCQIDRWSLLGLPLYAMITVPSHDKYDEQARSPSRPTPRGCTSGSQNLWVSRFVPVFLGKPAVRGVFWNQLFDSQSHDFAHGGLFDAAGHAKPVLTTLAALRRAYLQ